MPELPEVETTLRGIAPHLLNQKIAGIEVRQPRLRVEVTPGISKRCEQQTITAASRRGKYIILYLTQGALLIHLGMSGHLRLVSLRTPLKKHDHLDLILSTGQVLRYNDPRRFGLWLYVDNDPLQHPLLNHLGVEPLSPDFSADYFLGKAKCRTQPIKVFLMNNEIVTGIGNIYATESLFLAKIHPNTPAGQITTEQSIRLLEEVKLILQQAIVSGGTTLRDFYGAEGKPGYFALSLKVYGRQGQACFYCQSTIENLVLGGRSSTYCPRCQAM